MSLMTLPVDGVPRVGAVILPHNPRVETMNPMHRTQLSSGIAVCLALLAPPCGPSRTLVLTPRLGRFPSIRFCSRTVEEVSVSW